MTQRTEQTYRIVYPEPTELIAGLIETIENGRSGPDEAATRLAGRGHAEMATTFEQLSEQRREFGVELQSEASVCRNISSAAAVVRFKHSLINP